MKTRLFVIIVFVLLQARAASAAGGPAADSARTGLSFGPLPVLAYDADRGFQFGALLNIYNFGDGSDYPDPFSTLYLEASAYTTGNQKYVISYDDRRLIPGVRFCTALRYLGDSALDFYGFNGYQSVYTEEVPTGFYRYSRKMLHFKADFIGKIAGDLYWEAGYHFNWISAGEFSTDRYELDNTLFGLYREWGIIPDGTASGGVSSAVRAGLMYDTRDAEAMPSRGIWAEVHGIAAPQFLGSTSAYYKVNATFCHYIPLFRDRLVLAYRLNYQGFPGGAPWYMLPFYTIVGPNYDYDGIGGFRTARGIMLNRVQGLHTGFWNAEVRWRFVDFVLWRQDISFAVNAFCDGAGVFAGEDLSNRTGKEPQLYRKFVDTSSPDGVHAAAGAGLRFIMNRNFIVAVEYARSFNMQDGGGALYINTGFLF